ARFRWERPGGPLGTFDMKFSPAEGILHGKEVRQVMLSYTAVLPGPVEEVYACRVYGMALPLGFILRGFNKGVTLSFQLLEGSTPPPMPVQSPECAQYIGSSPLPDPPDPPQLNLDQAGLRERKAVRFCIQNLSAIPSPFTIEMKRYGSSPCPKRLLASAMSYKTLQRVIANPYSLASYLELEDEVGNLERNNDRECKKRKGSSHSSRNLRAQKIESVDCPRSAPTPHYSNPVGDMFDISSHDAYLTDGLVSIAMSRSKKRRILDDLHETTDVFFSMDGRERTRGRVEQREDLFVLKDEHGVAFLVEPSMGTLAPWGCREVTITAYNDTPGVYKDIVECLLVGAPTTRLPLNWTVKGSPLSLKRESLGLDLSGPEPLLSFGQVFVNGGKSTRVKNDGTLPALLTWSMHDANADAKEAHQFIKVSIKVESQDGKCGLNVGVAYKEPESFQSPFIIEPCQGVAEPRSEASFKVILPEHLKGTMAARLIADATWLPKKLFPASSGDPVTRKRCSNLNAISETQYLERKESTSFLLSIHTKLSGKQYAGDQLTLNSFKLATTSMKTHNTCFNFTISHAGLTKNLRQNPLLSQLRFWYQAISTLTSAIDKLSAGSTTMKSTQMPDVNSLTHGGEDEGQPSLGGGGGRENGALNVVPEDVSSQHKDIRIGLMKKTMLSVAGSKVLQKQERLTRGAIKLKAMAWGTSPRLSLDKKQHLERTGTVVSRGGGDAKEGKQFIKFEVWSTHAQRAAAWIQIHSSMRRQARVSLCNPLTIPVAFSVETLGSFVLASTPHPEGTAPLDARLRGSSRVRSRGGRASSAHQQSPWKNSTLNHTHNLNSSSQQEQKENNDLGTSNNSRDSGGEAEGCSEGKGGSQVGLRVPGYSREGCIRGFTLLPGHNLALDLIFYPWEASPEMSKGLESSFTVGTEELVTLFHRTEGELRIHFTTGHSQSFHLRGEVVRPMLTAAPVTHNFGGVHTEASLMLFPSASVPASCKMSHKVKGGIGFTPPGQGMFFLANPTVVDAEWSLCHCPRPTARYESLSCSLDGAVASKDDVTVDDPSVFVFKEVRGTIRGMGLPLGSSAACLPEDVNRLQEACWSQIPTRVTWGGTQGSPIQLQSRCKGKGEEQQSARAEEPGRGSPFGAATLDLETSIKSRLTTEEGRSVPYPLQVQFMPINNVRYKSRFCFNVRGGEGVEVVLEGCGTHEENGRLEKPPRV
ncbi:unnamed protein product, partial [Choristocarpus tenellus]